jgi:pimeloyl-ACP methyl ester carboxylesterase
VTTHYRKATIAGLEIFYREAGDPAKPPFLLLHGFPASSFMFRQLIDLLAGEFRVIAPDYPGFGHSEAPAPSRFSYTFDHLADIVEGFTEHLGLSRYGLYMQDFGGPVGFRLATRHPERVAFLVIQNANAYEEGLPDSFWAPLRAVWADPSAASREAIRSGGMSDAALEWNYLHGVTDPARVDPDNWLLQSALLGRPGSKDAMLDLLYDYRTNPGLYPRWQSTSATASHRPLSPGAPTTRSSRKRERTPTARTCPTRRSSSWTPATSRSKTTLTSSPGTSPGSPPRSPDCRDHHAPKHRASRHATVSLWLNSGQRPRPCPSGHGRIAFGSCPGSRLQARTRWSAEGDSGGASVL